MEEMETERSEMIANSSSEFEDYLFEILKSTVDSKALQTASPEDFYLELSNILVAIGIRDPSSFLERLRLLIDKIYNRTVLIGIICGLRDHKGVSLLKQMLIDPTLTNEELVALACSLGMIGGEGGYWNSFENGKNAVRKRTNSCMRAISHCVTMDLPDWLAKKTGITQVQTYEGIWYQSSKSARSYLT